MGQLCYLFLLCKSPKQTQQKVGIYFQGLVRRSSREWFSMIRSVMIKIASAVSATPVNEAIITRFVTCTIIRAKSTTKSCIICGDTGLSDAMISRVSFIAPQEKTMTCAVGPS